MKHVLITLVLLVTGSHLYGCQPEPDESKGLQRRSERAIEQNGPHFERANQALLDQMPEHAIEICKKGIEAGESACYRVVGIAYKQKGDYAQACDYFARARASADPHALTITRYEKHLKCASQPH